MLTYPSRVKLSVQEEIFFSLQCSNSCFEEALAGSSNITSTWDRTEVGALVGAYIKGLNDIGGQDVSITSTKMMLFSE